MKIVRNDVKETKFDDVEVGSVFIEDCIVFMKTPKFYEIEENPFGYEKENRYQHNAINLYSGEFSNFADHDMVKVCNNVHLIIN